MFNVNAIRKTFPVLGTKMNGKPLVYLDNASSTQKPRAVIDAMSEFYETGYANIHRGIYDLSERATRAYENVRRKTADFIGARQPDEIVFTSGTTMSINLVAQSWGRKHLKKGDEIILSKMEHHANIVPWQLLAREKNLKIRFIKITKDFTLDLENFQKLITKKTKLVAITHVSNVLGTINPVKKITALARRYGTTVLIDGAQSVPHMPVNVHDIGCDFFVFSAHKMYGPTGVGALYARHEILETMPPFLGGGEMIQDVTEHGSIFKKPPERFEAGTPNIASVIGLGAAIDFLKKTGMHAIQKYEEELTAYALKRLAEVPGILIHGPRDLKNRSGVLSFTLGIHAHDAAHLLDRKGIAVRSGKHCAHPLMYALGQTALTRASIACYNTKKDIDKLAETLMRLNQILKA